MTEEEAKTKWCPMRVPNGSAKMVSVAARSCIASVCMAWRYGQKPNPDWKPYSAISMMGGNPASEQPMYLRDETHGYCGLAGRPS